MNLRQRLHSHLFIIILVFLLLIIAAVSLQSILLKKNPDPETGVAYTYYNNFLIFRGSFYHLLENQDLYQHYPNEYYDLYKYSPTFAVLFAPIALLPAKAGLFLWNLLNALVLLIAFWKFPSLNEKQKLLALGLVLIEMVTSIQNTQSNTLMAGLFILAFIFLEKNNQWLSTLFIVLTVFIKIFGLAAFVLLLFYPGKLKSVLITIFWVIVLILVPLILVTPGELAAQYHSWLEVLRADHSVYQGMSVMSWLHNWFGLETGKNLVVMAGTILLCLPLTRISGWKKFDFRQLFLSSLLIWMVIFNHMAESPTFVIAVSGVALWFFSREKFRWENIALVALVFIFTVLSPTDLFLKEWRENLVEPYSLKAVPCIFIWLKIQYDLWDL